MYLVVMPVYLFIVFTLMVLVQELCLSIVHLYFFTHHVISLWRDTTSELWTPVLFFLLVNEPQLKLCLFPAIYFLQTILHRNNMVNPLCSAKRVRFTTSLNSWGKVFWLFVCRFPRCW